MISIRSIFSLGIMLCMGLSLKAQSSAKINCSYIRDGLYELGRVKGDTMRACNDLIYFGAFAYADGELQFVLPVNHGKLSGKVKATHDKDRNSGVMQFFDGQMNVGKGLFFHQHGHLSQFTFATHLKIDTWKKGAYIVQKSDNKKNNIALQLGEKEGEFILTMNKVSVKAQSQGYQAGTWNYVCVVFKSGNATLYDNKGDSPFSAGLPENIPHFKGETVLGKGLVGSLDETCLSLVPHANLAKSQALDFDQKQWALTHVVAYWRYDDTKSPSKDSRTWLVRFAQLKKELKGTKAKLRLGIAGGEDWKGMISQAKSRRNFAQQVSQTLQKYHIVGVDLDFEWAQTAQEYENYSEAIVQMRAALGKKPYFTVSLHPVSFRISAAAIDAVDFISFQNYGPSPIIWPMERYMSDTQKFLDYAKGLHSSKDYSVILKKKLLLGLPFYATAGGAGATLSYRDLVKDGLKDKSLDSYQIKGKTYTLNGVDTIRKKTRYALDQGFLGVMSWDLATDTDFSDDMSLNAAVYDEFKRTSSTGKKAK